MRRCAEERLENVRFVGAVSKELVREYWKLCDAALVLLRDSPLFEHVIPSKMFEAMGMERPIILGLRGESRGILEAAGAGIAIPPQSGEALAEAIVRLAGDPAMRQRLGRSGRAFAAREYDRARLAERMLDVLSSATDS
jgi:glycosyltransferase involved in cell wall biosynthesis